MKVSLKSCGSCSFIHISRMRVGSLPASTDPPSLTSVGIKSDPGTLLLYRWRIAIWTFPKVGETSSDSFTGTCGSRSMVLPLIENVLFCTQSKCSAYPSRILFSDIRLVPSALRNKEEQHWWDHRPPSDCCKSFPCHFSLIEFGFNQMEVTVYTDDET